MKIYIDFLFAQYFIINYFLIELALLMLHEIVSIRKKVIAAIFASACSIVVVLLRVTDELIIMLKLIIPMTITYLLFNPRNAEEMISHLIVIYIVTYLLGGILISIINETNGQELALLLSSAICVILIYILRKYIQRKHIKENLYCNVGIVINKKTVMAKAFIDTGNSLYDLISGDTVIIANEVVIKELSEELLKILNGMTANISNDFQTKIRMVSYDSVGNINEVLYGVKADEVVVYYDGKEIKSKKVIVALNQNGFKNFDVLIGLNLIEGGYVIGNSFIVKNESKKIMG